MMDYDTYWKDLMKNPKIKNPKLVFQSEVEKALVAIETCREESLRCRELVAANGRIAVMARALYRSGLSDYLDVIDAERNLYQSQTRLVGLVSQQYINYVVLCKALGGGWER